MGHAGWSQGGHGEQGAQGAGVMLGDRPGPWLGPWPGPGGWPPSPCFRMPRTGGRGDTPRPSPMTGDTPPEAVPQGEAAGDREVDELDCGDRRPASEPLSSRGRPSASTATRGPVADPALDSVAGSPTDRCVGPADGAPDRGPASREMALADRRIWKTRTL